VSWYALKEYANGALWVIPAAASLAALAVGFGMSQISVRPGSMLDRLAFQGTADDARVLLISVSTTVVTVIALVLGLTVVALQLASTQFSPRLLRKFLRDRPTQIALSVFMATFVYSAAGLFTVGLASGTRTDYPRLAVSVAIVLLFISLGMVVYFADHLAHAIQIDAVNRRIERDTRRTIAEQDDGTIGDVVPRAPDWAVPIVGKTSGYIQTVHPQLLLPLAAETDVTICLRDRVGEHVVAGTVFGWVWASSPDDPRPSAGSFEAAVLSDIRIGFERTIEQDIGFGIRQQIDIACKALSPAINDPYTAVQAIDHLTVLCCDLAVRPLGAKVLSGPGGRGRVVVPREQLRRLHFLHRWAVRTLRVQRRHRDVGIGSSLPNLCRGSSRGFRPLGRPRSGCCSGPCRRRTLNTTPNRSRAHSEGRHLRTQQDQLTAPAMTSGLPPRLAWPRPNTPCSSRSGTRRADCTSLALRLEGRTKRITTLTNRTQAGNRSWNDLCFPVATGSVSPTRLPR